MTICNHFPTTCTSTAHIEAYVMETQKSSQLSPQYASFPVGDLIFCQQAGISTSWPWTTVCLHHIWSLWGSRHGTAYDAGVLTALWKSSSSDSSGMDVGSWWLQDDDARCCDGRATGSREQRVTTSFQTLTDMTGRLTMMSQVSTMCYLLLIMMSSQVLMTCHLSLSMTMSQASKTYKLLLTYPWCRPPPYHLQNFTKIKSVNRKRLQNFKVIKVV